MSWVPGHARVASALTSPADALADAPYPERAAVGVATVGCAHAASHWLATQLSPDAVARPLVFVPLVFLVAWVGYAAVAHALTGEARRFGPTLGVVAWGFAPTLLVAVARPIHAVLLPASLGIHPRALTPDPPLAVLAVGAIAMAWQWYVMAAGLRGLREVSWRRAGVAAGLPLLAVFASAALSEPLAVQHGTLIAVFLVAVGVLPATVTRGLLSFRAALDLVGFRGRVEPEDWYVALHRLAGGCALLFALLVVGAGRFLL